VGYLSQRKLYEENLEGGLLYYGLRRIFEVRLWKWAPVYIGVPLLGNMWGRSFPRFVNTRKIFFYIFSEEIER